MAVLEVPPGALAVNAPGPGDWLGIALLAAAFLAPFAVLSFAWRAVRRRGLPAGWIGGFALAGIAWELTRGHTLYRNAIADGAYTGATLMLAFIPAFALWGGSLAGLSGWGAGTLARGERRPRQASWAFAALILGAALLAYEGLRHRDAQAERALVAAARAPTIAPEKITEIIARWREQPRSSAEIRALAANPKLPEGDLRQLAREGDDDLRTALAANPRLPADLLTDFAGSSTEMLRYYVTFNRNTPISVLEHLAKDSSTEVSRRAQAALETRQRSRAPSSNGPRP